MIKNIINLSKAAVLFSSMFMLTCHSANPTVNDDMVNLFNINVQQISDTTEILNTIKDATDANFITNVTEKLKNLKLESEKNLIRVFVDFMYVKAFSLQAKKLADTFAIENNSDTKNIKAQYANINPKELKIDMNSINLLQYKKITIQDKEYSVTDETSNNVNKAASQIIQILKNVHALLNPLLQNTDNVASVLNFQLETLGITNSDKNIITVKDMFLAYIEAIDTITSTLENNYVTKITQLIKSKTDITDKNELNNTNANETKTQIKKQSKSLIKKLATTNNSIQSDNE